jgi:branched-chain amino acid transport system substrate-binding protein
VAHDEVTPMTARRPSPAGFGRRHFLKMAGATTAAAAAGTRELLFPAVVRAQEPIRIGQLIPFTGFLGAIGEYGKQGATLAVEELNAKGGVLNRKIELITEDEANPGVAVQKARKLIERDRVVAIEGLVSSASCLAVGDEAQRAKVLVINAGANSDEIRSKRCHRYVFCTEGCNTQYVSAIGTWLIKSRKITSWYFITSDYAFGHDLLRVARNLLHSHNGTEVGSDLVPTGTADFSQYITKMKQAKPDLIFHNLAGADVTNFLKQVAETGFKTEVAGGVIDSAFAWPVGESLRGAFPIIWWHEINNPSSRAWAARFMQRWGRPPDNQAYGDYMAVHAIAQAIEKAKSTDSPKLVQALEGHTLGGTTDGLKGRPLSFRAWDHQLLQPMYVVQAKDKSKWKDKWDIFEVISEVPGKSDSLESIAIPKAESQCALEPLA